jgi:hypothetical protein
LEKDEYQRLTQEHEVASQKKKEVRKNGSKNAKFELYEKFSTKIIDKLDELLELASQGSWRNITQFSLVPKMAIKSVCKCTISTTRQQITPGWILKQNFSTETRSWVATQLNRNDHADKPSAKHQASDFSADIVLKIGLTYLLSTVKTDKSWTAFRGNVERPGIAERVLKRFLQYLNLDWKQFFIKVSIDVKACIQGGGRSAGDEII